MRGFRSMRKMKGVAVGLCLILGIILSVLCIAVIEVFNFSLFLENGNVGVFENLNGVELGEEFKSALLSNEDAVLEALGVLNITSGELVKEAEFKEINFSDIFNESDEEELKSIEEKFKERMFLEVEDSEFNKLSQDVVDVLLIDFSQNSSSEFEVVVMSETSKGELLFEVITVSSLDEVIGVVQDNMSSEVMLNRQYGVLEDEDNAGDNRDRKWWNLNRGENDEGSEEGEYLGEGVKVLVLDSGVMSAHKRLEGIDIEQKSFVIEESGESDLNDYFGHGTFVMGILVDEEFGLVPEIDLYSGKVLNGKGLGSSFSIYEGIMWGVEENVDVISISVGAMYSRADSLIERAISKAYDKGIVIVAASGNCNLGCYGFNSVLYPGSSKDVITVGSIGTDLKHSAFSSYDELLSYSKPDVVAIGEDVVSIDSNSDVKKRSGTSFSTPKVTAEIVKFIEKKREEGDDTIGVREIQKVVRERAVDVGDEGVDVKTGYGHIEENGLFLDVTYKEPRGSVEEFGVEVFLYENDINDVEFLGISDVNLGYGVYDAKRAMYMYKNMSIIVSGYSANTFEEFSLIVGDYVRQEIIKSEVEIVSAQGFNYLKTPYSLVFFNLRERIVYEVVYSSERVSFEEIEQFLTIYSKFVENDFPKSEEEVMVILVDVQEEYFEELKERSSLEYSLLDDSQRAQWAWNRGADLKGSAISISKNRGVKQTYYGQRENWYTFSSSQWPSSIVVSVSDISKRADIDLELDDESGLVGKSDTDSSKDEVFVYKSWEGVKEYFMNVDVNGGVSTFSPEMTTLRVDEACLRYSLGNYGCMTKRGKPYISHEVVNSRCNVKKEPYISCGGVSLGHRMCVMGM